MGHGLYRINRALCGKLQVVIPEGKIRPMAPLVAAKFATECNIAVRNHVPVLKHWKEYKKKQDLFKVFTGRLSVSAFSTFHHFENWSLFTCIYCSTLLNVASFE
jgi:hypothetical protein